MENYDHTLPASPERKTKKEPACMEKTEFLHDVSLKDHEEELRKIYQNAPFVMILLDENRKIRQINDYATSITGKDPKELLGLCTGEALGCFHALDGNREHEPGMHCSGCALGTIIVDTLSSGQNRQQIEVTFPLMNQGKRKDLFFLVSTAKISVRKQPMVLVSLQDITERKLTEQQLKLSYARMETLSKRILRGQEEDRARLARELHDEVGQALTVVKLDLQMLNDELAAQGYHCQKKLLESVDLVDTTLERVRRQSVSLRPPALDDMGLIAAVKSMARGFGNRTKINTAVTADGFSTRLSQDLETALFRCVQEALTNVARHARAKKVDVVLNQDAERVTVQIKDDGIGFKPKEIHFSLDHIGLTGMQERVELLQGELRIESKPNQGTQIYITIPLQKEEE